MAPSLPKDHRSYTVPRDVCSEAGEKRTGPLDITSDDAKWFSSVKKNLQKNGDCASLVGSFEAAAVFGLYPNAAQISWLDFRMISKLLMDHLLPGSGPNF